MVLLWSVLAAAALAAPPPVPTHAFNPVWSPDGRHLAWLQVDRGGETNLFHAPVEGERLGEPKQVKLPGNSTCCLGPCSDTAVNPVWHPIYDMLFFEGLNDGGQSRLYFASVESLRAAELLSVSAAPGALTHPVVSPDGMEVMFVAETSEGRRLLQWSSVTNTVSPVLADSPEGP